MFITAREQERLMISLAAMVARDRQRRGVLLNLPEATAVIGSYVLEGARDGRTVAELMEAGRHVLTRADVVAGVGDVLREVQIEATFPDGTKLVTIHDPLLADDRATDSAETVVPGEVIVGDGDVDLFAGRQTTVVEVVNTGDRPIQVGSHYHFAEVNPALQFDRAAAYGFRLAVAAGTSVRFEPGIERSVELVAIAGARFVPGLRGQVAGPLDSGPLDSGPSRDREDRS